MSNEWCTPDWLFKELNKEFNFDIDLCATRENSKCDTYCTDYLNNEYQQISEPFLHPGKIVFESREPLPFEKLLGAYREDNFVCFMNPPYSNPKPFIEKAWEDSKHCKIVCLVKCDPSTKWWSTFWDYDNKSRGSKPGCKVRFFPKRIQFDPPMELVTSGGVWKLKNKWVQKCENCIEGTVPSEGWGSGHFCHSCKGKSYKPLSGPNFSCALIIMDRRSYQSE